MLRVGRCHGRGGVALGYLRTRLVPFVAALHPLLLCLYVRILSCMLHIAPCHPAPPSLPHTSAHTHPQEYLQDLAELPETPWALKGLAQVYTAQGPTAAEKLKQVGDHTGRSGTALHQLNPPSESRCHNKATCERPTGSLDCLQGIY
jgi:hypothetical protein